jgi:hypothetical protein
MALDAYDLIDLGAGLLAASEAGRKLADLSRVLAPATEEEVAAACSLKRGCTKSDGFVQPFNTAMPTPLLPTGEQRRSDGRLDCVLHDGWRRPR